MNREKETLMSINDLQGELIGECKKPVLLLLPLLSQIALSLAVIADKLSEDDKGSKTE